MYTQTEYTEAARAMRRFVLLYSLFAAALLGLLVFALVAAVEWLTYVSAGMLAVGSLFLWGNFGVRLFCWNRFLSEMKRGLERETEGVIASIDEEEATKEGLEFRALHLFTGESSDKAGGRLLYVDSSRFPLQVKPGEKVKCRLYGNYIKEITALGEE